MTDKEIRAAGSIIAACLGVVYNGPQYREESEFRFHVFTDSVTHSSFGAADLSQAKLALVDMRKKFYVNEVSYDGI